MHRSNAIKSESIEGQVVGRADNACRASGVGAVRTDLLSLSLLRRLTLRLQVFCAWLHGFRHCSDFSIDLRIRNVTIC